MANEAECRSALQRIRARLSEVDPQEFAERVVERTISCRVPDLDLAFRTRLHAGGLAEFTADPEPESAQVKLTVHSDDLVRLADDELHPAKAWASGRLKIDAAFTDLLRLRRLL